MAGLLRACGQWGPHTPSGSPALRERRGAGSPLGQNGNVERHECSLSMSVFCVCVAMAHSTTAVVFVGLVFIVRSGPSMRRCDGWS